MNEFEAWCKFEQTGKVEDYLNYCNAVAVHREEGYPDGCNHQRSGIKKAEHRRKRCNRNAVDRRTWNY